MGHRLRIRRIDRLNIGRQALDDRYVMASPTRDKYGFDKAVVE
jgi:hypothetical protein